MSRRNEAESPLLSVVIPTYNRAERLRITLASVLNQTFEDFEVLVMDDGSTDATRDAVERFGDPRVRYSWAENSGGPAAPRNRGIDEARAEWICFLDADDLWYPEKLEKVYAVIAADGSVDAVSHHEYSVASGSPVKRLLKHGPYVPDFYRRMLLQGNRCSTSAMSVRKSFLDRHSLRFNTASNYVIVEDFDLWLRMARAGAKFRFLDDVLGEYVLEADNMSSDTHKALDNLESVLWDHVYHLQEFDADKDGLWRYVSLQVHVARARELARAGRLRAALQLGLKMLLASPASAARYVFSKARWHLPGLRQ